MSHSADIQQAIQFPGYTQRSFHNSAMLQGEELAKQDRKSHSLEARILEQVFRANPGTGYTTFELMKRCDVLGLRFGKESSLRRALCNLSSLDKWRSDGKPAIVADGKRVNAEFSDVPNTVFRLNL